MKVGFNKPVISVIIPVLNEEKYINRLLISIQKQICNDIEIEILLIDGMSKDKTRLLIAPYINNNLRLIDNEFKTTPHAFNIGIREARGEYIALLGAHCEYDTNYLECCLKELINYESVGCSGKVIPTCTENTIQSKLVMAVLSSPFGVSSHSFRTIESGYAHSVNFPVYRKDVIIDLGGYNTAMRRNQDNLMNRSIIEKGFKLYITDKTSCKYFVSGSLSKLMSYAYNNGKWNVLTLLKDLHAMRLYHFVPLFFVLSIVIGVFLSVFSLGLFSTIITTLLVFFLSLYFLLGFIFSLSILRHKRLSIFFIMPFCFFIFHFSYGAGSISALPKLIFKRKS